MAAPSQNITARDVAVARSALPAKYGHRAAAHNAVVQRAFERVDRALERDRIGVRAVGTAATPRNRSSPAAPSCSPQYTRGRTEYGREWTRLLGPT